MAATAVANEKKDAVQQALAKIRSLAPEFAKAAEHIGRAMRGSYLKLIEAIDKTDLPSIEGAYEKISNSELVTSTAAKFHHMREKLDKLLEIAKPFAGVALGTIIGLAGFIVGGTVGPILFLAGFLYAAYSAVSFGLKQVHRASADTDNLIP
ncbi:hypothetical protein [Methylorubrum extorquens]|uniref:Channel forming colicins domain-containing protein n=1 Tax=Methylorubrum extorquens TaxID=408 RepID=A0AAX3WBQ6_METEX|nr:hypothetical protein [Methylorubrum extorquens]WHQ68603.1 hypothetical protein KEC54_19820 [Methylorubrum extorquens]